MALDQEICTACRRPRDAGEIQAGYDLVHQREARRRRRPRVAAAWALTAAAALLLFRQRQFFLAQADSWRAQFSQEIEKARDPGASRPQTAAGAAAIELLGGPPAPHAAAAGAHNQEDAPTPRLSRAPPPPPAPAPPRPARAAKKPEIPLPGNIILYGVVYDLKTALVVPGAVVILRSVGAPYGFNAATDEDGYYAIQLPLVNKTGNYIANVRAKGYRDGQLEDADPPYRERPEEKRLGTLSELSEQDLEPVPVRFKAEDEIVPLDLVLAPEAGKTPP